MLFGEDSILKVFRKITPGINPDIEIHERLTQADSTHIAALYGWVEHRTGTEVLQLGMLQQFLRTATDGWDLALASVRNLFAEEDLHAHEAGGDFAAESTRLGEALREIHGALATALPTEDAPSCERDRRRHDRAARRGAARRARARRARRQPPSALRSGGVARRRARAADPR